MIKASTLFIFLFVSLAGLAQEILNRDSLLGQLKSATADTNKVYLLISIGQQYENNEPEKAKGYYAEAGRLSRSLNFPLGVIKYIANYTYVLNLQGKYDSSLLLNQQSVSIARTIGDSIYLGKTLINTGTSFRSLGNYESAVASFEEGKAVLDRVGNEQLLGQAYDILQVTYNQLHQYTKGVEYGKQAVAVSRKYNDSAWLILALNNLGTNYVGLKEIESGRHCYTEALTISKLLGDINSEMTQYLNLADIMIQTGNGNKTQPYYSRALKLSRELEATETELVALKGLSLFHIYTKDFVRAKAYADTALQLSYLHNYRVERRDLLSQLSNIAYAMHDVVNGKRFADHSNLLADSLLNARMEKNLQDLELKYETERREARINGLEQDKKAQELLLSRKNLLNILLIGAIVAIVIIAILLYRTYRTRQKLQQRRITELETERQLTATEAVLEGEEKERTRLAKDLHDGLGGMLSGIKFSFSTMKERLILTEENAQAFERSLDMLDSSIHEMRRVAHNMMPEALVKFGLDTALSDFIQAINNAGAIQAHYQSIGLSNFTLPQSVSNASYRIIQELVNNIIKHAGATRASIQVSKNEEQLSITVEDDGRGLDMASLQNSTGMGWSNIRNRVALLKGTIDVQTPSTGGTSIFIQFIIS